MQHRQGYEQHDAQEALRFLLNDMHDKLCVDVLSDDMFSPPPSPALSGAITPIAWGILIEHDTLLVLLCVTVCLNLLCE